MRTLACGCGIICPLGGLQDSCGAACPVAQAEYEHDAIGRSHAVRYEHKSSCQITVGALKIEQSALIESCHSTWLNHEARETCDGLPSHHEQSNSSGERHLTRTICPTTLNLPALLVHPAFTLLSLSFLHFARPFGSIYRPRNPCHCQAQEKLYQQNRDGAKDENTQHCSDHCNRQQYDHLL